MNDPLMDVKVSLKITGDAEEAHSQLQRCIHSMFILKAHCITISYQHEKIFVS